MHSNCLQKYGPLFRTNKEGKSNTGLQKIMTTIYDHLQIFQLISCDADELDHTVV